MARPRVPVGRMSRLSRLVSRPGLTAYEAARARDGARRGCARKHEHYGIQTYLRIAAGQRHKLAERAIETCAGCNVRFQVAMIAKHGNRYILDFFGDWTSWLSWYLVLMGVLL